MNRPFLFFFISAIFFFSIGCKKEYVFEKEINIGDNSWYYSNHLDFDFEINDLSKKYDLLLDVFHEGDYGFQNLYVKFKTIYPSGEIKEQVVSLELASRSGVWNGSCSGTQCTVEIPLQKNAVFEEEGQHLISVEQYMRKNPLKGIMGMKLKIRMNE